MPYVLFGIGIVMAITGAQAAMSGWDIVVVERGWALLIAGSVFGTGGMIVAALGLVLIDLRRAVPRTQGQRSGLRLPGMRKGTPAMVAGDKAPSPLPAAAAAGAAALAPNPAGDLDKDIPAPAAETDAPAKEPDAPAKEPLPGEAGAMADETDAGTDIAGTPASGRDEDGLVHADPVIPVSDEDLRINRPSGLEAAAAMQPQPDLPEVPDLATTPEPAGDDTIVEPEPQEEIRPEQPEMREPAFAELRPQEPALSVPTVVKTYTAGGHSYIMFSDGTIEADTPEGLFTFRSLDELKAFIAEKAGASIAKPETGAGAAFRTGEKV